MNVPRSLPSVALLLALLGLRGVTWAEDDVSSYRDELSERSRAMGLAESRDWQVLGHYRPLRLGGWESEVDGPAFFLSPEGKNDPAAELQATLDAFFVEGATPDLSGDGGTEPARCRFPARFAWLDERLGFDREKLPSAPCPRFEHWRDSIGAESATMIFASAYGNNPSSMFGHTLLRLDRANAGGAEDLLAYVVNYAALPTTENPVLYTILGLAGGFPGFFATMPYYLKVQEYTDMEDRNLWEYRLGFDRAAVDRMVRHLWELGHAWFDYYYLTENCSYHLLAVLEAGDPSLHLVDRFQNWVIPGDTVRGIVETPGLVRSSRFRPSRFRTMVARREGLSPDDAALAARLADDHDPEALGAVRELNPERGAAVLDTASELSRYRAEASPNKAATGREREILRARGALGVQARNPEIDAPPPPESGHGVAAVSVAGGYGTRGAFVVLYARGALHDLLDRTDGYFPGTQIEMFGLELRAFAQEAPAIELERAFLARIVSLAPLDPWVMRPSWHLTVGVDRVREEACAGWDCVFAGVSGGPGVAVGWRRALPGFAYLFADLDVGAGAPFRDRYRLEAGASAGVVVNPIAPWRVQLEGGYLYPLLGVPSPDSFDDGGANGVNFRLQGGSSYSLGRDLELRATAQRLRGSWESSLGLRAYF